MYKKNSTFILANLLTLSFFFSHQNLLAHSDENQYPFSFEGSYIGDFYGNASGGLLPGVGFMGMANMKIGFDAEKAGWWKGGSFFINGASIHGKSLTENFLGDLQVASNIDAGEHIYLYEFWFKQEFSKFSFTVGLQDLNVDFLTSENGGEFVNSSHGIMPTIAANLPAPIFPLTGLGVTAQWQISDNFLWQAALFDGCQRPFEHNPHNLHWDFSDDDGLLAVTEFSAKINIAELEGAYKFGLAYQSGLNEFNAETQKFDTIFENNFSFYVIAEQTIYERNGSKIGLFAHLGISPKEKNEISYYFGFGANYFGIFSSSGKDVLGIAVNNLGLHRAISCHETVLELQYKWQFNDNFGIQPDIQYIINPAGFAKKLDNALAYILRFHVNF